ncbi:MAG: ABC transporter ATP-binding protein [Elusimicrobiota bacterium]
MNEKTHKEQQRGYIYRFIEYLKPYWLRILIGLSFMGVVSIIVMIVPSVVRFVIDKVIHNSSVVIKLFWFEKTVSSGEALNIIFVVLITIFIIRSLSVFTSNYIMSYVSHKLLMDLRMAIFKHLQLLSMKFYDTRQTGKIMARITSDVDTLAGLSRELAIELTTDTMTLITVITILFIMNAKLAVIALCVLPLYVINYMTLRNKIRNRSLSIRENWAEIYGGLQEVIAGAKVVKSFTGEKREELGFFHDLHQTLISNIELAKLSGTLGGVSSFLHGLGVALILWLGGREVIKGDLTAGALVAFYSYLGLLYAPVIKLTNINEMITRANVSLQRIFEILDTQPEVKESENAKRIPDIKGHVVFENVCFNYEHDQRVLKNIQFEVFPGTINALVGRSGAGKTTVTNLICRFYDPSSGRILVDGNDLSNVTLKSLRSQIGIVLQESFLFSGTINDNLKYSNMDATQYEIIEAAKAANAHEFIMNLPRAYESQIGERGVKLSGGQKQRLAIARAILRNPRILILDEATSALDSESEALIQEALERLMLNRTSFVIAHRLSTILKADKILAFENGELMESGKHDELLKNDGVYARLYNQQFKLVKTYMDNDVANTVS